MYFYKFVNSDNIIVEVLSKDDVPYLKYWEKSDRIAFCYSREKAFGVKLRGKIYSFENFKDFPVVKMIPITPSEYEYFKSILGEGDSLPLIEDSYIDNSPDSFDVLNTSKLKKIEQMSLECKNNIIKGTEVELSDGKYHFDLSTEDQLNINRLRYALQLGEENIAYHSKNGKFKYYSREDIKKIISDTDKHILYHTSYFNALKNYINSL